MDISKELPANKNHRNFIHAVLGEKKEHRTTHIINKLCVPTGNLLTTLRAKKKTCFVWHKALRVTGRSDDDGAISEILTKDSKKDGH